jgi:hypothetical protein
MKSCETRPIIVARPGYRAAAEDASACESNLVRFLNQVREVRADARSEKLVNQVRLRRTWFI